MTIERIIASGPGGAYELNDNVHVSIAYEGVRGLLEPLGPRQGAITETADRPIVTYAQPTDFGVRQFSLSGFFKNGNGRAELRRRAHDVFAAVLGRPTEIGIGSLALSVELGPPKFDRISDNDVALGWYIEGRAAQPNWRCLYGYAVGGAQSIWVADDRLDRSDYMATAINATGSAFSLANPGSAPTDIALMISGLSASTSYVLRNVDQRSTRPAYFTTGSVGVKYLGPSYRIPAFPGTNIYRIENPATGALIASGTIVVACVPIVTQFRYLGNDADKFTEGPVFHHYRRGTANYSTTASSTLISAGDMVARVGGADWGISGVAASAGLVLEQSGTNLLASGTSEDFSNGSWKDNNNDVAPATDCITITDNATTAPDDTSTGSQWMETATNTTHGAYQLVSIPDGTVSLSVYVKANGREWVALDDASSGRATYYHLSGAGSLGTVYSGVTASIRSTGGDWYRIFYSYDAGAGTQGIQLFLATGDTQKIYLGDITKGVFVWGAKVEAGPPTSYVAAAATRNADQCALYRPHNYLKYSRDLTQATLSPTVTGPWVTSGTGDAIPTRAGTVADGTASGSTWAINNTDNRLYQAITPDCRPNSTPWTAVVALRQGTLTGANNFDLRIEDQGGTLIGSATTITASDLSASATRTYYVTVTAAQVGSDDTGLQVALQGKTGTGTVIVESIGLVRGSFPGPIAHTEGSNIPLPAYGYEWPDWITQNGYFEFDAVLPPISTGLTYYVVGESTNQYAAIWRDTGDTTGENFLHIARRNNVSAAASTTDDINVGAIWDGAAHTLKLWWRNYTLSGTQYMIFGLDVDGVNKSTSANVASSTVTSWASPERLVLSLGSVMATIRGVSFGAYAVPAGAIPAAI